jgi:acetyl-CoA acetyltransferase family protein
MHASSFIIYGAYGFTGQLIAELAVSKGHQPILAGRDEAKTKALAERLNLPWEAFSLNDTETLNRLVKSADVLLNCAGPYSATAKPAMIACLKNNCHYIDITGEMEVFEYAASLDAAAQEAGLFADEIIPMTVKWVKKDKATGEETELEGTVASDECNRPETTLESLQSLNPVFDPEKGSVTAGNSSQLSDGASMTLVMSAERAEQLGLEPLAYFRGFAVAGCAADEMGIGPVFAIPKLLNAKGLSIDDMDIIELNEAFASQAVYCRDKLGIDNDKLNVNGGSISIGHPYGMTGSRLVGHAARELQRRKQKYGLISMCIGGGQGAAGLIEAC